jgi:thiamine-monophosphate kinase
VTEGDLIAMVKPMLPSNDFVVTGAGDDCAVLETGTAEVQTLFKTDSVVEGIHFTVDEQAERVGRKALARCLSDIGAMGGTPTAAVVTIGLRKDLDADRVKGIYRGLCQLAAQHQVAIVGGETTSTPERLILNVALLGTVPRGQAVLRSGAKVGDALFVTGELGGSIEGKHLDFEPRVAEGRWLAEGGWATAMMDLSDGIASDLPRLLACSGVPGAEILKPALPLSREARVREKTGDLARPAVVAALCDGEDYELMLTVPRGRSVALIDAWRERFPGVRLSCIGVLTERAGVFLRGSDGIRPLTARGYEHSV